MSEDLGYIGGYLGEGDKGRDLIDIKIPGIQYSLPVVKYDPEGGLSFPWLPRDSNEKLTPYGTTLQQTISDGVADTFKYGLEKNPSISFYEDPTYLSYDLIFDVDGSPLFDQSHPNGIFEFMNKYQNMTELTSRRDSIYYEFFKRFYQIFQTGFDESNSAQQQTLTMEYPKPRAYYAESIGGLDKLNEKIVNYGEDKITITLTEDISMTALYLAELYNNLVYSYKSQKFMIPDNCVRFDMLIKISDMRNFKVPNPKYGLPVEPSNGNNVTQADFNNAKPTETNVDNPYKSQIIYRLHDCNFDFFKSMNIGSNLSIGGYNASLDMNPAKLTFEIYYKSISKEMTPSLIAGAISLRNKMIDLSEPVAQDKTLFSPGKDAEVAYIEQQQNAIRNKSVVIPALTEVGNVLKQRFKEVRGEMLNELIQTIKTGQNITFHHPPNIYQDDIFEVALDAVKTALGNQPATSAVVTREQERLSGPPIDLDGIPPSDLDPNYHHLP